jgi:hypothetical protein
MDACNGGPAGSIERCKVIRTPHVNVMMAYYVPERLNVLTLERLNVGHLDYSVKAKERGFFGEKKKLAERRSKKKFPGSYAKVVERQETAHRPPEG